MFVIKDRSLEKIINKIKRANVKL